MSTMKPRGIPLFSMVAALAIAGSAGSEGAGTALGTPISAYQDQGSQENARKQEKTPRRETIPPENRTEQLPPESKTNKTQKHEEKPPGSRPISPAERRLEEQTSASKARKAKTHGGQPARAGVRYEFRPQDTAKLRQRYHARLSLIDRAHRPHLVVGAQIPKQSVAFIEPVPVEIVEVLPPIPEDCEIGYWDGYCLVYYPDTLVIVGLIDLLIL